MKRDLVKFTFDWLANYLRRASFYGVLSRGLRDILRANRSDSPQYMKNADTDVDILKEKFRELIGKDWRSASRPNDSSKLGLRGKFPWSELAAGGLNENGRGGLYEWVEGKVRDQARWQRWGV